MKNCFLLNIASGHLPKQVVLQVTNRHQNGPSWKILNRCPHKTEMWHDCFIVPRIILYIYMYCMHYIIAVMGWMFCTHHWVASLSCTILIFFSLMSAFAIKYIHFRLFVKSLGLWLLYIFLMDFLQLKKLLCYNLIFNLGDVVALLYRN